MSDGPTVRDLVSAVRAWLASNYPGSKLQYITIHARRLSKPIRLPAGPRQAPSPEQPGNHQRVKEQVSHGYE